MMLSRLGRLGILNPSTYDRGGNPTVSRGRPVKAFCSGLHSACTCKKFLKLVCFSPVNLYQFNS